MKARPKSRSRGGFNPAHAETVSDYVVSLLEAGLTGNEIGVITRTTRSS